MTICLFRTDAENELAAVRNELMLMQQDHRSLLEAGASWVDVIDVYGPCGGCGECSTCTLVCVIEEQRS